MSADPASFACAREDGSAFSTSAEAPGWPTCVVSPYAKNAAGYGVKRVGGTLHRHHRLVYAESRGVSIDSLRGLEVMHLCDNPACVNPCHLQLGTHTDNMRDMFAKGRRVAAVGESNGRARLTEAQVKEIRASGGSQRQIAARFGIANSQVSLIKRRKIWRHL
ncbi:MAG TPA: HNH endonuclease [Frateuria sp.]|uniref:HNH endonuclease n=1 Tax=Frateuria sp. TaxID=2211372 RepID=UPI002DEE3C10|nr:HNH endonuclease [Frateuria sp.]